MTEDLVSNSGLESRDKPGTWFAEKISPDPLDFGDDRYTLKNNIFNMVHTVNTPPPVLPPKNNSNFKTQFNPSLFKFQEH